MNSFRVLGVPKTIVAVLLSFTLAFCAFPTTLFAEDTTDYVEETEITETDAVMQVFENEEEEVLIEGENSAELLSSNVRSFSGDDMFETAALEAKAAYPSGSSTAILVGSGDAWIDALAVSSLAAAKGPILFSNKDSVPKATTEALKTLGVKSVIIVGGTACISDATAKTIQNSGFSIETRLYGNDCLQTQLAIYNYGVKKNIWNTTTAIVATMSHWGDALSLSPLAYNLRAPIFLVNRQGNFENSTRKAILEAASAGKFKEFVIGGGSAVVSEKTKGFLDSMVFIAGNPTGVTRLAGDDQYKTSVEIAKWGVSKKSFSNSSLAFATGKLPYDALAGSVVQGKAKSPLLLVDDNNREAVTYVSDNASAVNEVKFFGGTAAVTTKIRNKIIGLAFGNVVYENTGISLNNMINLEVSASKSYQNYSYSDINAKVSEGCDFGNSSVYQFAELDNGCSGKVSASQLNAFVSKYGAGGNLVGKGQAFIDAAKQYGVNEVYLLSHAILESGWGKSELAKGWSYNGKTYYNFYGIGAYDSSPLSGGRLMAYQQGWDTPEKAISGAAKWISEGCNGSGNYFNNSWNQNTLYKMRWNYNQAASSGQVWKQYATDKDWATKIADIMNRCYSSAGIYAGTSGLVFVVPRYS